MTVAMKQGAGRRSSVDQAVGERDGHGWFSSRWRGPGAEPGGRGKKPEVRSTYSAYPGPARHRLLGQFLAGDPDQQVAHQRRPDDRDQAGRVPDGDQEDAPPHAEVAEVVRVPRVAPEPGVEDLALVVRIRLEPRELGVADGLEDEPDEPDHGADHDDRRHRRRPHHGRQHRQHDDDHDAHLRQVDLAQHVGGDRAGRVVVAEHLRVARVLALAVVAPADVDRASRSPQTTGSASATRRTTSFPTPRSPEVT